MPKGFFSQGVCLLTDGRTSIADVKSAIEAGGFHIDRELPAQEFWSFGGPAVLVPYRPEVNGGISVDVVNRAWPDEMADPKSDAMTFGAWSMGYFGPFAYPGALERAAQHARGWEEGHHVAQSHRGFIRIRSSYVGGGNKDAPVLPDDYDAVAELTFVSRLAMAAASAPGVLCHFNPNGEVLRDLESFRGIWDACAEAQKLPLLLWINVRLFNLNVEYALMDTVGNEQLDVTDLEVLCPTEKYDPGTIDYYLRNVTHYLLDSGREIQTGEAIDGPEESELSWTAEVQERSSVLPPRRILRLYPKACGAAIKSALAAARSGK